MSLVKKTIVLAASTVLLVGCASSWKHKDDKPFNEYKLHGALASCQFEKQRKASHPFYRAAYSGTEEHRRRMTEEGDKVFKKAILCMKKKGFVKDGYNSWLEEHQHIKTK